MAIWRCGDVRLVTFARGVSRMKRIVILGAGTAGTIMANRLAKRYWRDVDAPPLSITVVDQYDEHVYQPGLLFVPFGTYRPGQIVKARRAFLPKGVHYVSRAIV